MTSHSYEVALFGEFFPQDLKAILNRITLHSEASQPFRSREIVFEPLDAQAQRDLGAEPVLLRAKKEVTESDSPWCAPGPFQGTNGWISNLSQGAIQLP
jgi:mediator of RNA polymerase II transcription subunit 18